MASIAELSNALINADKAGDVEAARALAGEIQKMQNQTVTAKQFDPSRFGQQPIPEQSKPFDVLPLSEDAQGNISFDSNAGIVGAGKAAFNLPGEVARGEIDPLSDEGVERAAGLAMFASPATPAIRAGSRAIPGVAPAAAERLPVQTPSAEALLAAGKQGYKDLPKTGVEYRPAAVAKMADMIKHKLQKEGLNSVTAKNTNKLLDLLANPPKNAVAATIQDVQAALKTFKQVRQKSLGKPDSPASTMAIKTISDFIKSPPKGAVLAGPSAKAARMLKKADANYGAGKRSKSLTDIEGTIDLRAAAANSGRNVGNTTRSHIASLLTQPKRVAGFDAAEKAALEGVVRGSKTANATRYTGNLLGGGGGPGQVFTGATGAIPGLMAGSPTITAAGAIGAPIVGATSKAISNRLSKKALGNVDDLVRQRSPLYQDALKKAPVQFQSQAQKKALIKALLAQRLENQPAEYGVVY